MHVCIILLLTIGLKAHLYECFNRNSRHQRCCPGIGCFSNGNESAFSHIYHLPKCSNEQRISLYLSIPQSKTAHIEQEIVFANLNESVHQLKISPEDTLFVIIHGFNNTFPHPDFNSLCTMINIKGHCLLLVDWTDGARTNIIWKNSIWQYRSISQDYRRAIANGRVAAAVIALTLDSLIKQRGLSSRNIHLVGHSLGAHIAGFVGARIKNIGSLDPAAPEFDGKDPAARLDKTDALFVQVIHSSDYYLSGTRLQMGHVDFYANGGSEQPGCNGNEFCNHRRAAEYFVQSVKNSVTDDGQCKFVAYPCSSEHDEWKKGLCHIRNCREENCAHAGYQADSSLEGTYYFHTVGDNSTSSGGYCGNQIEVTLPVVSKTDVGTVELAFDTGEQSSNVTYWKFASAVRANQTISTVKSVPWKLRTVKYVHLRHGYGGILPYKAFLLHNLTIHDTNGNSIHYSRLITRSRCLHPPLEILEPFRSAKQDIYEIHQFVDRDPTAASFIRNIDFGQFLHS